MKTFLDGRVTLHGGDCLSVVRTLADNSIDSCVTDPPYALVSISKRFGKEGSAPINNQDEKDGRNGPYHRASRGFMGKQWDTGETAFAVDFWAEVLRVLKPGGHVAAFGGTRSYHRLACAIEDAGFEVRDQLAWVYGQGFPKSLDVSKAIDKAAGAEREVVGFDAAKAQQQTRAIGTAAYGDFAGNAGDITAPATDAARQWNGWGTALKPAWEPICLARKPLSEKTVAANVLRWGTGAINVGACKIGSEVLPEQRAGQAQLGTFERHDMVTPERVGRFPANLCHDGSDEVLDLFPEPHGAGAARDKFVTTDYSSSSYDMSGTTNMRRLGDSGSAARFFYSAKASKADRALSKHPTVKPVKLMQWLVRLITPPGGVTLDPFAGTGTTGEAAWREGFSAVLIEREEEYQADIERRMLFARARPKEEPIHRPKKRDCDPGTIDMFPLESAVACEATNSAIKQQGGQTGLRQVRSGRTIGPIGLKW